MLSLLDVAAEVGLGVEHQHRRLDVLRMVCGRALEPLALVVEPVAAELLVEDPVEIARAGGADVVVDGPLRDRRLEAVVVRDRPRRHEAAV